MSLSLVLPSTPTLSTGKLDERYERRRPAPLRDVSSHHKISEIAAYQPITKQQDVQIISLTKQAEDLQSKLSEALSQTQQAVEVAIVGATKEMAQKDEQLKNITNDCRRALDPERKSHVHLDISTVTMFVKNYGVKREQALKELERREMSLGAGQIVQDLKDVKAKAQLQARQCATEREELNGKIVLLSAENTEQKRLIKTLGEQIDALEEDPSLKISSS